MRQGIVDDCYEVAPAGVELVNALSRALPQDAVLVSDLTLAAYWCRRLLGIHEARNNVYPWGFCTLGFGLPAAIGAKAARPDRPVVCVTGDAGFLFNVQELATAMEADFPIVVLLFDNRGFGVLKPQQQIRYGRTLAVDTTNPDFLTLSRAFGVNSERIETIDALQPAVVAALESGRMTVLHATFDVPLPVMEGGPRAWHQQLAE